MKRKLVVLFMAAVAAVPVGVVTASPAAACDEITNPCSITRCKINEGFVTIDDTGTISYNGRPIECYF